MLYLLARTLRLLAGDVPGQPQRSSSGGGGGGGTASGANGAAVAVPSSGVKRQRLLVHQEEPQPPPSAVGAGEANAGVGEEGASHHASEAGADSGHQVLLLGRRHSSASQELPAPAAAPGGDGSFQATSQELVDLASRVEGLDQSSGLDPGSAHVRGYLRSILRSVLVLLEPHAARTASGGGRMRTAVQKACLALKEKLVALAD